jgi:phosphohistidine phosphatase
MTMRLILVRHAIALDGDDDDARPLSDRGRARFRRVVSALERLGVGLDLIVHSPKLRALETAEALVPLLRAGGSTEVLDTLADFVGVELLGRLETLEGDVALVGHEPHLSVLLACLTTGDPEDAPSFRMKKGGVAVLEGDPVPACMTLELLLTPRAARRLT